MASLGLSANEKQSEELTRAGFDLLFSMAGTFHELYEQYGGVEAVIRERHGPNIDPDDGLVEE